MMATYFKLILAISLIAFSSTTDSLPETGDLNDESVESMISDFESVEQVYFPNLQQVVNNLNSIISDKNLSRDCKKSLIRLTNGIVRKQHWALSFYDSSSQGKSGKLSGLKADFGHFDECIHSKSIMFSDHNRKKQVNFKGQFCMLSIRTNEYDVLLNQNPYLYNKTMSDLTAKNREWYEFNLGNIAAVCIPSTCQIDPLLDIINQKLANSNITIVSQNQCSKLNDQKNLNLSLMELIAILVLSGLVGCVLVGTYSPVDWLRHFDAIENNRKLFKKITDPERLRYKAIHGFKFLYLLLYIMAHVWFIFMPLIPLLFGGNRNYDIGNILFREISAGSLYLPDVMFLIGGLLTCVMWYPLFEKTKGKISFFNYALLRWLRTTPVIVSVLLIGFIYPKYGSGPFFNELANHMQTNCRNNFWKNLLYIANFDRGLNMCLPQTWYICVDFQLYLLHYVTIFYLYKRPIIGLSIAAGQILISCFYIFWSTFFNELPSYLRVNEITLLSIINTEYHYLDTMVHSNVYTIGILMGWLMVIKRNILKVKPFTDNILSLASFLLSLSIFFIPRYWMSGHDWISIDSMSRSHALLASFWASIVRIIFISYFVYSFYSYSFGGAKYLRFIMTYDFQVPFSRICLSMVVAQFIYILYYFGSRRDMISFNTFDQTKEGIAAFFICSVAGYLLYLIVEAPFSNILTDFAARKKESPSKNKLDDKIELKLTNVNLAKSGSEWAKIDENNNLVSEIVGEYVTDQSKKIS